MFKDNKLANTNTVTINQISVNFYTLKKITWNKFNYFVQLISTIVSFFQVRLSENFPVQSFRSILVTFCVWFLDDRRITIRLWKTGKVRLEKAEYLFLVRIFLRIYGNSSFCLEQEPSPRVKIQKNKKNIGGSRYIRKNLQFLLSWMCLLNGRNIFLVAQTLMWLFLWFRGRHTKRIWVGRIDQFMIFLFFLSFAFPKIKYQLT